MTSAVRYSRGHARMRALKSRLWTSLDRPMLLRAGVDPDGHTVSGAPEEVFPPLVRWYVTLIRAYPSARTVFLALLRLHEIENLKLLWRAAARERAVAVAYWRPLEPLATIGRGLAAATPHELVHRLSHTPYDVIARALLRSHAADLPATEIGLDRWALGALRDEALRLPAREDAARRLLLSVIRERDVDLLRRGTAFGLDADLIAKSTVVLSRECAAEALNAAAAWRPGAGPLWRVLPVSVVKAAGPAATWDDVMIGLRRARLRACLRAFVGWPFQLAPALAALLLREEQARAAISIAAARAGGSAGHAMLPLALAASLLEG
jgi:hypothetical protein